MNREALLAILLVSSAIVTTDALAQSIDSIHSSLRTVDIQSGRIDTVYSADRHFEAPNWSPDGRFFVVNSRGRLYRVSALGDKRLEEIPTGFATRANNDHGISPDGKYLVLSHHAEEHITDPAQDWLASSIYIVPITGGASPTKVTTKAPSFWHGWSPDGKTLAFVGRRNDEWDIYAIPVDGGEERRLTTCRGLDDGPDYAPDGKFIYYNSFCSGRMQIWRMRSDGSQPEQLTHDAYSSWFPHPSPDGRWVVYIAYLEDQGESHPFGRQVKLRLMDLRNGSVRDLTTPFFGGQGTINVPSWSPDSRRVAFVVYERDAAHTVAGAQIPSDLAKISRDSGMTDRRFPPTFQAIKLPTNGTVVNAVLYRAQGPELHPVIVFLHGFPGNERNLDVIHSLRSAGFHVLFFNYRGSWGSGGSFSFASARADIGAATAYLRRPEIAQRLRIDPNRLYLVGHSMGGWLALAGAADDPTIRCTVALMPWNVGRVGALLSDPQADSKRFMTSFTTNTDSVSGPLRASAAALVREVIAGKDAWDFIAFAPHLANRATLVVASTQDEVSPEFQRTELDAAMQKLGATKYRSLSIEDDHAFSAHRLGIAKFVIAWLRGACER